MRVIAGSARRLQLKTPKGYDTRPTSDKIKETLFNILSDELFDVNFLDLFAGSGGIGIEALSRGAKTATFVEQGREALKCIRENLVHTKFEDNATVIGGDVFRALLGLGSKNPFDIVFMDPPFNHELERKVLEYLAHSKIITEDTLIIVEASLETEFDYAEGLGFEITRVKEYKTSKHVFLKRLK
ncbi:MAG: 16S rRNA (guanine(966)-N(2))-methyltransferase RsmD [Lachnospiraceae bacterium]|jgi:16S rRNA (guanine966-N2)-methyltransferase|nr:16S rRNA (guanine(966)-N(2))-methyltransferase RsmD [Lachnospiraceae bacterium]